jgi:hypothetical protein
MRFLARARFSLDDGEPFPNYFSGSGMSSVSQGTGLNPPVFQSSFDCSIRSLREDMKSSLDQKAYWLHPRRRVRMVISDVSVR